MVSYWIYSIKIILVLHSIHFEIANHSILTHGVVVLSLQYFFISIFNLYNCFMKDVFVIEITYLVHYIIEYSNKNEK